MCKGEIRWMQRCSGEIVHLREGVVSVILSATGGGRVNEAGIY